MLRDGLLIKKNTVEGNPLPLDSRLETGETGRVSPDEGGEIRCRLMSQNKARFDTECIPASESINRTT